MIPPVESVFGDMSGRYRLHHVGIVVPGLEEAVANYSGTFEFKDTSVPFDDVEQQVRVAFVHVAPGVYLEFITPSTTSSPVTQFLSKNPRGGLHHLAYEVEDIETAVKELLAARAVVVCHPVEGFEGRRVAFVVPNKKPRLLTELVEPHPDHLA